MHVCPLMKAMQLSHVMRMYTIGIVSNILNTDNYGKGVYKLSVVHDRTMSVIFICMHIIMSVQIGAASRIDGVTPAAILHLLHSVQKMNRAC